MKKLSTAPCATTFRAVRASMSSGTPSSSAAATATARAESTNAAAPTIAKVRRTRRDDTQLRLAGVHPSYLIKSLFDGARTRAPALDYHRAPPAPSAALHLHARTCRKPGCPPIL